LGSYANDKGRIGGLPGCGIGSHLDKPKATLAGIAGQGNALIAACDEAAGRPTA
jgi:hypothetical protein